MAQAAGSCSSTGSSDENVDVSCVYRAVDSGETAARVRELIEHYASKEGAHAHGSDEYEERRWEAVNYERSEDNDETLLEAAYDQERGDLVGALLENGADATVLGAKWNALALAICYDQTKTLRALLSSGRHRADEELRDGDRACLPVHAAVLPLLRPDNGVLLPPRLDALELLVREFGADVSGRDSWRRTPLHWAAQAAPGHRERAVNALLVLGADVEARDKEGRTPIFAAAESEASVLFRLLAHGASADVMSLRGDSPLMYACLANEPIARATVPALLAIDQLVNSGHYKDDWGQDAICELISAGAPVKPSNAARVLPIAARHGARLEARVAARPHAPPPWQMHEAMVKLAFDFQDVRAAEEGVSVRERRVQELEEALRARGGNGGGEDEESGEESGAGEGGGSGGRSGGGGDS